jgi:hypothetical protein
LISVPAVSFIFIISLGQFQKHPAPSVFFRASSFQAASVFETVPVRGNPRVEELQQGTAARESRYDPEGPTPPEVACETRHGFSAAITLTIGQEEPHFGEQRLAGQPEALLDPGGLQGDKSPAVTTQGGTVTMGQMETEGAIAIIKNPAAVGLFYVVISNFSIHRNPASKKC